MNLSDIKAVPLVKKRRKRVGRGSGSGHGRTSCRGMKGQKPRGSQTKPFIEGGVTQLWRRIPKRGFSNNYFRPHLVVINLEDLNEFQSGSEVTLETLRQAKIIKEHKSIRNQYLKILGRGQLHVENLKVKVHKISQTAQEKIKEAKGSVQIIRIPKRHKVRRQKKNVEKQATSTQPKA